MNTRFLSAAVMAFAAAVIGPCARAQKVTSVSVGTNPVQVVVNPATNTIYCLNVGDGTSGTVSVIDGATNTVKATVPVTGFLQTIAVNPLTSNVYVVGALVSSANGTVTVINGASNVVATIPLGRNPGGIAIDTATNQIYVVTSASNDITMIDGATNTTSLILTDILPVSIAVDETTDTIWYGNGPNDNDVVTEVGPNGTVDVPLIMGMPDTTSPLAIAVNPLTDRVYVISQSEQPGAANFLTVIDGTLNTPNVTVPLDTTQVTIEAYDAVAVNQATDTIYVTDSATNQVTVINGATNAATTVPVGSIPAALALNSGTNQIYVANSNAGTVSVIDGAKNVVTATVPVGTTPVSIAVNPVTNVVYVANDSSNNVSVIAGSGPAIGTQPDSQIITSGGTVVFTIGASLQAQAALAQAGGRQAMDSSGITYQWQFNGSNLTDGGSVSGSTGPQLVIMHASTANNGNYACVVTSGGISATSNAAALSVTASANPGLATSISTRAFVGTGDNILIGGFFVVGSTSRSVLVQGLGPALGQFGVTGFLAHPTLSIHQTQNGSDVTLYSNTGWGSGQVLLNAAASVFASPVLPPNSPDSELLLTLPPGGYSAEVSGADGGSGVALCAIYELP